MTVYSLKSGKTYTAPSLFVNPQNELDVDALWKIDEKNNLTHIDGVYVTISDYKQIHSKLGFSSKPLFNESRLTLRDKILLIDPALDKLLTGMNDDKQKMFATGRFDNRIERIMREIQTSNLANFAKSIKIMEEVYPLLRVRPLIEMQIESNADVIISPCINLTSSTKLLDRIAFAKQMLIDTRTLLETSSLKKYKDTKDLMNIITLSKTIISNERNFHNLFDLLLCNEPDHVGIKLDRIQESDTITQSAVFKFFRQFYEYAKHKTGNSPPLHFINVNELGYVGYCSAVSNIVCPIGHSPHYPFPRRGGSKTERRIIDPPDTSMKYYHPINMDYPKYSEQNPFPCACFTCAKYKSADNVPYQDRAVQNRMHWLNIKDGEIQEFRETPARLDIALRDKFARAMRMQLIAYLPTTPVFVH